MIFIKAMGNWSFQRRLASITHSSLRGEAEAIQGSGNVILVETGIQEKLSFQRRLESNEFELSSFEPACNSLDATYQEKLDSAISHQDFLDSSMTISYLFHTAMNGKRVEHAF